LKECLDQRFSLWDFGPWTPSKVILRLVELLLEQLDNSTSLLPPTLKKMWTQFHSSSSTSWPQSLNMVVPFQFFNYFGLHFVAGKSNMIDCIFITLHKDFCGPLVLGGNTESICHYWWGCEFCIPKDKMISFRRTPSLEIIFILDQFWGSKVGACDGICGGGPIWM